LENKYRTKKPYSRAIQPQKKLDNRRTARQYAHSVNQTLTGSAILVTGFIDRPGFFICPGLAATFLAH